MQAESLSIEFYQTHRYSFTSSVKGGFKLSIVPIGSPAEIRGVHYVLVIDASGSMDGEKIEAAKEAAEQLVEKLPDGNLVSIVVFGVEGQSVEVLARRVALDNVTRRELRQVIRLIRAGGWTPLYRALLTGLSLVEPGETAYLILLSDGRPTDGSRPSDYREINWPRNVKPVTIGIGFDYDPELMSLIADLGGGFFFHISELNIEELVDRITEVAAVRGYAKDVTISVEPVTGDARLIGYGGNEAYIPVLRDETVNIYGEVTIPPMHRGVVARIHVSYTDAATGERVSRVFEYTVEPAETREQFLSGIDKALLAEVRYHSYMEEARRLLARQDLAAATQKLAQAEELAKATMRLDLVQETRTMRMIAEQTMRISDRRELEEATRKLMEKATKTLRVG